MTNWFTGDFAGYLFVGGMVVLTAWVPLFVGRIQLSLPMIAVAIGALVPVETPIDDFNGSHSAFMLRLSEFALLVSVFGAGLKLDRRFSLRAWASTWRLLGLVMPLSIGAAAVVGHVLLGLPLGLSMLLGAMLAPTDPVLASGFGVGPPGHGEEGEPKFALTSEAGLNDGLAFPFVTLGLVFAGGAGTGGALVHWALWDLLWNVCGGVAVGLAVSWLLVAANRMLPDPMRLSASNSGTVSVGLAFIAYGIAIALGCNGFVAVFCEAAGLRNFTKRYEYSERLNHAAEQFERLAMVGVLILMGVSITKGQFNTIGGPEVAYAALLLLLIRPIAVLFGCLGSGIDRWTRGALAFFGIRGIASLYYITFVGMRLGNGEAARLTAVITLVVLCSVVLYGTSAGVAASYLIRDDPTAKERQADEQAAGSRIRGGEHEADRRPRTRGGSR